MLVSACVLFLVVACFGFAAGSPEASNSSCIRVGQGSTALWDAYVCNVISNVTHPITPGCYPTRRIPSPPNSPVAGMAVIFHGYTACPESFRHMSDLLQENGFYVLSFLSPGHGRVYFNCSDADSCSLGYPIESLPDTREGYINFIHEANKIAQDEATRLGISRSSGHVIASMGLSLGGALATFAVADGQGFYTHKIAINAFYGIGGAPLDSPQEWCGMDFDYRTNKSCLQSILNATLELIEMPEKIIGISIPMLDDFVAKAAALSMEGFRLLAQGWNVVRYWLVQLIQHIHDFSKSQIFKDFFELDFTWGDGCVNAMIDAGRQGQCSFKIKNILAAHAFAQYSMAQSRSIRNVNSQDITVQRDQPTRNAFIWQTVQASVRNGNPTHVCMFQANCTDEIDNLCGVPHALVDPSDNLLVPPKNLYWEQYYMQQSLKFLLGKIDGIGEPVFTGDISVCVKQDTMKPNPDLVNVIIEGVRLVLDGDASEKSESFVDKIRNDVANFMLTNSAFVVAEFLEFEQSLEIVVELPDFIQDAFLNALNTQLLTHIGGRKILSFKQEQQTTTLIG